MQEIILIFSETYCECLGTCGRAQENRDPHHVCQKKLKDKFYLCAWKMELNWKGDKFSIWVLETVKGKPWWFCLGNYIYVYHKVRHSCSHSNKLFLFLLVCCEFDSFLFPRPQRFWRKIIQKWTSIHILCPIRTWGSQYTFNVKKWLCVSDEDTVACKVRCSLIKHICLESWSAGTRWLGY